MHHTPGTMLRTAVAVLVGVAATVGTIQMWPAAAAPGDTDATFVPLTPCRLFDYRPAPDNVGPRSTPLSAGQPVTQQVTGNTGNCVGPNAVPAGAKGVALNVTAIAPSAQSNLRLFPADAATPLVSNLNFSPGQKPVANKVDVKLSPDGKVKILNHAGTVYVAGDVVGYYTGDTLTEIDDRLTALEAANGTLGAENEALADDLAALEQDHGELIDEVAALEQGHGELVDEVSALQTVTLGVSAYSMRPVNAAAHVVVASGTCAHLSVAGVVGAIAIDVPVGATITAVHVDLIDGDGSGAPVDSVLGLVRVTPMTSANPLTVLSNAISDAPTEVAATLSLTPAAETVDVGDTFFVTFEGGINVGQNQICGVRVTYTR